MERVSKHYYYIIRGKCRKDLHFEQGKATATYDGVEKEVSGTWSLESPNSVLYVGKSTMTLIFTPDDLNNYEKATQKVDVVVNLRLLSSKTKVSCGDTIDFSIDPDIFQRNKMPVETNGSRKIYGLRSGKWKKL